MRPFFYKESLNPDAVFTAYKYRQFRYLPEPANTIRAAMVWEYLCLGLNLLFVGWARAIEAGRAQAYRRALASGLGSRRRRPHLVTVELTEVEVDDAIGVGVSSLIEAMSLFDQLPEDSRLLLDESRFESARRITDRKQSANQRARLALEELLSRHQCSKGDEAWIECTDTSRLDMARLNRDTKGSWQLPKRVSLHGYRMAAFDQIARDLGGL
jgi:hypothetical protein